jgi:nucleoid-associated protein YgaU
VPTKPYPTLKGIGTMLQEIAGTIPDARKVRPEQLVDLRFIKELDTSGFIDQLYKAKPVVIAEKPQRLADQPVSYVVKAGDTLSHLAEWFYGSALKWGRIYEANRKVIINPDYIYVGQQIIVPAAT